MYEFEVPILGPDGHEAYTTEQPYMASKFEDPEIRAEIMATADGRAAKSLAKQLKARGVSEIEGWYDARIPVMTTVVDMKFRANLDLADRLIGTGNQLIVEGNQWEDRFWGVSPIGSNNGENNLGKILMKLRHELAEELKENGHILPPSMYNLGGLTVNAALYPHLTKALA
jgi:ribA/ribD-fused uncharacterized protein